MHPEAERAVFEMALAIQNAADGGLAFGRALDIGGQAINGECRHLFEVQHWDVLDQDDTPGVTIVADATKWVGDGDFDLVLCTEMYEHVKRWNYALYAAWTALRPGGWLVLTCASELRAPHGATGAPLPAEGEWYQGVPLNDLITEAVGMGFRIARAWDLFPPGDSYMLAQKSTEDLS